MFGPNFDMNQLFPGVFAGQGAPFSARYKCYSIAMYQQSHASDEKIAELEHGGKILLPQSALDYLTRLHIEYPMMFKITNMNVNNQRITHAGVMEFHQEEGKCYMPYWMMRNLLLVEGDIVQVDYVRLQTATYMKLQPQSTDFLDISNQRAVLELKLRSFSCLTKSDMIAIDYNNKTYEFLVEELKPANAVSIIECDMNVEFSAPVGFKEPEPKRKEDEEENVAKEVYAAEQTKSFVAFGGKGYRSDGKEKPNANENSKTSNVPSTAAGAKSTSNPEIKRGIPNYDYTPGKLTFIRTSRPKLADVNGTKVNGDEDFKAFSGSGQSLKSSKKVK